MECCSLETEQQEQQKWQLLPEFAHLKAFDQLLRNGFMDPGELGRSVDQRISQVLNFCAAQVPHYRGRFEDGKIPLLSDQGMERLQRLQPIGKTEVVELVDALLATSLPPEQGVFGWTSSSGTTGRPTRVLHSVESSFMFTVVDQRQLRWFRWNPRGLRADIRIAAQFPRLTEQPEPQVGGRIRAPRWRYVGRYFQSGNFIGLCVTAPLQEQLAWLQDQGPDYLMAYPSTLERLAHALGAEAAALGLKGIFAISEQMTRVMRRRIEDAFALPVDQNYGLNEIGKVAQRCHAGRYHVNVEHCIVEILDDGGNPCAPGQIGHLVISALRNLAMPLLRYDSGDLAEAVDGPCPCGRSLPAFGAIVGRYRRMVGAPEGTSLQVFVLKKALEAMPRAINANLRQYQIRQQADGSYVVLLCVTGALPAEFEATLRQAWEAEVVYERPALALQVVEAIPPSPSGKVEDFISEIAMAAGT